MPADEARDFTVVVTRAPEQSAELTRHLSEAGFSVVSLPAIEIVRVPLYPGMQELLIRIKNGYFDWLVFTSRNGVESLHGLQGEGAEIPPRTKVAVQGTQTGESFRRIYGRGYDLIPGQFVAESLLECFNGKEIKDKKVLIPRARETRGVITDGLRDMGADVTDLIVYETRLSVTAGSAENLLAGRDPGKLLFSFFSPSAFRNALTILGAGAGILKAARIASIGPVTSKAIREAGYEVDLEARDHSEQGFMDMLRRNFRTEGKS